MNRFSMFSAALGACMAAAMTPAHAQDNVVNLYSARHYQTDEALYANFTKLTGIKINRLDGREDELVERIRNEGSAGPADILMTVDASRLEVADKLGLFQPVKSAVLEQRVPAGLRTPTWFAFSTRARVIAYNKANVKRERCRPTKTSPSRRSRARCACAPARTRTTCRSVAAMIAHDGEAKTEEWARAWSPTSRAHPRAATPTRCMAVAAGECGVAISNSYYLVRLMRSTKPSDQEAMKALGVVWPNQSTWGTHINVSGAGVLKNAPHKDAAIKFLEYLASDEAQGYFANGNNEWPVVKSAVAKNKELESLGDFKPDALPVGDLAKNVATAQKAFDRAGWK